MDALLLPEKGKEEGYLLAPGLPGNNLGMDFHLF